ncbi:MAG TPA: YraN family protein [Solirubrobacteraceae bacterium]|nr:YraN family protein [Solirubrobacteraceae bacterium]
MTSPPSANRKGRAHDPRRTLGCRGEQIAADYLRRRGYSVLDRNVRTRRGEIDLVAFKCSTLVFVEVKTRRIAFRQRVARPDQRPLAGLRADQRSRLRGLAAVWLADERRKRPFAESIRFDAIGILLDPAGRLHDIEHIKDAW